MPMTSEWVQRGKDAIVALLERGHAAVWPEIEAKLAEGPGRVDPHHLTTARRALLQDCVIDVIEASTRGGGRVPVIALVNRTGRR